MFTGMFVQRNGPGGAVRSVGGGIVMGLVGTPGTATIGGKEPRTMYTGRFVHSGMAREELSPIGMGPDRNESVRGASVVEEPGVESARARNSRGPSRCPLLVVAGTSRTRGGVQ